MESQKISLVRLEKLYKLIPKMAEIKHGESKNITSKIGKTLQRGKKLG
jgi:hypothetical protein